jgi:hypothetical protein
MLMFPLEAAFHLGVFLLRKTNKKTYVLIMIKIKHLLVIFSVCIVQAIVGCATSSPIQRYGESESAFSTPPDLISNNYPEKDIYRIYHRGATSFVTIQSIRNAAMQRAENFARQQNKSIIVLGEKISQPPYILGNFPRIEIVFVLVDKEPDKSQSQLDKYSEIEKLKKLLDQGALTQEEFDREKAKILK